MPDHLTRKIDTWWAEFARRAGDIEDLFARRKQWDLAGWMERHLQGIDEHLMWEIGPAVRGKGRRLVITPEGRRHLRPLVGQILRRSPRIDGWEFYAYRLPEDYEMAERTVEARTGGSIAKTFFRAAVNEINQFDLVFLSREYASAEDKQALLDTCVATETLLGEEILDRWIGAIEVSPLDYGPDEPQGIRDLKCTVDSLIEQVKDSLPEAPYFRLPEGSNWTGYRVEPEQAEDYPYQRDLFAGHSRIDPMWRNAHSGLSFDSVRFSRHGEVFCYVKIDGISGFEGSPFADKCECLDSVDEALRKADAGCFVGGGTGLRYSYLDLALTDVDRGVQVLRQVLREGKVPRRSWILFFDTDLQTQWIGVWDDTPAPPMEEAAES